MNGVGLTMNRGPRTGGKGAMNGAELIMNRWGRQRMNLKDAMNAALGVGFLIADR